MTVRRSGLLAALAILVATAPAMAQTPCTDPLPTKVLLNPTKSVATLDEQGAVLPDGSPSITEYLIGVWPQGTPTTTAPLVTQTVPKAAFTLLPGTTNCYQAVTGVPPVPAGPSVYVSAMKARRVPGADGSAAEESAWSVASNPFGRTAAPLTPPRVVVR